MGGWDDLRAILPVLILFGSALLALAVDVWRRGRSWSPGSLPGTVHLIACAGAALAGAALLGDWRAPPSLHFDGALRVDLYSRACSAVIVLGTLFTCMAAGQYLRRRQIEDGEFHALVLLGAGGMVLLAESQNLIMLFLSLETFSMAAYVLSGFTRDEKRSVEGALKYLILGGFSSGFLLLGLAFIFGAAGEVRLDSLQAAIAAGRADPALLLAGAALTLVGFGFKVGAFPFHGWLPDAYEGAPTLVTGYMAVAVKTAAFAALTRVALTFFQSGSPEVGRGLVWALSALAILTCVFGNLVAMVQSSVKRMLAYSGIAHTGYLLIGLAAAPGPGAGGSEAPGSAVVFYLLPYALMTFGAFAVLSLSGEGEGDLETFDSLRGLSQRRPLLAFAMLLFMVSLAGIPPSAGFWAKLYLFREAVWAGRWDLALVGILTSIWALYYYLRVVVVMYMQAPLGTSSLAEPSHEAPAAGPASRAAPAPRAGAGPPFRVAAGPVSWAAGAVIGASAAGVVLLGLFPAGLLSEAMESIRTLLARI